MCEERGHNYQAGYADNFGEPSFEHRALWCTRCGDIKHCVVDVVLPEAVCQ